jgi:hypothetical protein
MTQVKEFIAFQSPIIKAPLLIGVKEKLRPDSELKYKPVCIWRLIYGIIKLPLTP